MRASPGAAGGRPRSVARLAAVQALYEMDVAGAPADPVLGEFMSERWRPPEGEAAHLGQSRCREPYLKDHGT